MFGFADLPVRVFDDLRVEADPGARLTPDQGLALAERLIGRAVHKQITDRNEASPVRKPRARKDRA